MFAKWAEGGGDGLGMYGIVLKVVTKLIVLRVDTRN